LIIIFSSYVGLRDKLSVFVTVIQVECVTAAGLWVHRSVS